MTNGCLAVSALRLGILVLAEGLGFSVECLHELADLFNAFRLPRPRPTKSSCGISYIPKDISQTLSLWTIGLQFAYIALRVFSGRRKTMASKKPTKKLKSAKRLQNTKPLMRKW